VARSSVVGAAAERSSALPPRCLAEESLDERDAATGQRPASSASEPQARRSRHGPLRLRWNLLLDLNVGSSQWSGRPAVTNHRPVQILPFSRRRRAPFFFAEHTPEELRPRSPFLPLSFDGSASRPNYAGPARTKRPFSTDCRSPYAADTRRAGSSSPRTPGANPPPDQPVGAPFACPLAAPPTGERLMKLS